MTLSPTGRRLAQVTLLTVLFMGPVIHYCGTIILFGVGAVSSAGLVSGATRTLLVGAFAGAVSTAVCRGRAVEPMHCAKGTGTIALLLWALPYGAIALATRIGPAPLKNLSIIVIVMAAAAWATGYMGPMLARRLFPQDWGAS